MRTNGQAGLAVRKLRLAKGLTLAELSQRTGVPLSTLSKLELGQSALGYEKLLLICRALGVDPGVTLLQDPLNAAAAPSGRRAVSRAADGHPHKLGPHPCRVVAADLLSKCFTPMMINISTRSMSEHGPLQALGGETYLHVLQGVAVLHTDIYAPLTLMAGESVYFDGRVGHAIVSGGEAPCQALLVVAGDEMPATAQTSRA